MIDLNIIEICCSLPRGIDLQEKRDKGKMYTNFEEEIRRQ
jgi:hypothetical protein